LNNHTVVGICVLLGMVPIHQKEKGGVLCHSTYIGTLNCLRQESSSLAQLVRVLTSYPNHVFYVILQRVAHTELVHVFYVILQRVAHTEL
jgi:hypothetical protein